MSLRYIHLDVFTDTPLEGNQLAVFPAPPRDIEPALMQRIAAEMNFSESTFVFPGTGKGDVRMRIFTPGQELPIAGHPTIGSTFALAAEGTIASGRSEFVFELGVGPTPVSLEWKDGRLVFAWMTQPLPSFGAELDAAALTASLGIEAQDLRPSLPAQSISCGVPFLFVPLASRAAVDRVAVDQRAYRAACGKAGVSELPVFLFTTDRQGAAGDETVYSRMLAPGFGIVEDPATGSASGPLGCYLVHHGMLDAKQARSFVSLQGAAMRRPSRIHISIETSGKAITRVRVGGQSVIVGSGELTLPVR
jgi:trans-2,3-dihydro-3-hydroxyanthranilate isomerase